MSSVIDGRPVRIVLGILGLDQHEAGALAVARILRDAGCEVVYLGRFQQPVGLAAVAIVEDADVVAISCHSWEFLYYTSELVAEFEKRPPRIPIVLGGSVVTERDRDRVMAQGIDDAVLKNRTPDEIVDSVISLAKRYRRSSGA